MNERIQELAHEAGLPTYNPEGVPTKLEKFAELIVRECVELVALRPYIDDGNWMHPSTMIREHFGVE